MNRAAVFSWIDEERARQDEKWPRGPENPHRQQYRYAAPHILLLEEKVARLRSMWYDSHREKLRAEFLKVAAIAVRALEEIADEGEIARWLATNCEYAATAGIPCPEGTCYECDKARKDEVERSKRP